MVIDSHQHFWTYSEAEFGWIDDSMAHIRKNFLPADLARELTEAGVAGSISVQARTSLEETWWLLDLASRNAFVLGVVGWVPLHETTAENDLDRLASNYKLRGVREVTQGRPPGALLGAEFNRGISLLRQYGLAYDILVFENQLEESIEFVDRHPEQAFILDHIAKPRIREKTLDPWAAHIGELARRENVFCKLSGMVTEADPRDWTSAGLKPYFDVVLASFGPERLMFGSDWPVCLVGCEYTRWLQTVRHWCSDLSRAEQNEIFSGTAFRAYKLG